MKLKKAIRRYYREEVEAASLTGGEWRATANGRARSSLLFSMAFHAVMMFVIVTAMISWRYQPSLLGQQMLLVSERYCIEDRLTQSIESLIQFIKISRSAGGKI